ncbi:Monocarboxylate transporter 1 [Fukomys damarensis]|uniref:Monocarboxylate transporter 1 n=1 Tax=Fukomys damarensis TaxID=885580 RepID=A0A091DZU8_FUKDA|nr:Monocarboxylate transporter 1 [Fukomys damarensis]
MMATRQFGLPDTDHEAPDKDGKEQSETVLPSEDETFMARSQNSYVEKNISRLWLYIKLVTYGKEERAEKQKKQRKRGETSIDFDEKSKEASKAATSPEQKGTGDPKEEKSPV